jgi:hypothetical protein
MNKLYCKFFQFTVTLIILSPFVLSSQSLYKVEIDEKIQKSTAIFEGKVISQQYFWNPEHTMIFTSSKIELYKLFKGSIAKDFTEVVTQGGTIGNLSIEASDLLTLSVGETGIFFAFPNKGKLRSPETGEILFDIYSSSQGFYSYDLQQQTASAPFVRYASITNQLYAELIQKTGRTFVNKKSTFKVEDFVVSPSSPNVLGITSFSPAVVNAGATIDAANNVLTINGTDFGTPTGSAAILFDDANNGTGGTPFTLLATDNLVISWTNTQIQVRVPSRAGTGTFAVRDALGATTNSPSPLIVNYAILTATFSSGGTFTKESNLMNDNGSGGYTYQYSTSTAGLGIDFNAASAKATFERAASTWREVSGLNIVEGATTAVQAVASDGINLVVYDNTNAGAGITPIPSGVLAVCYSFNSLCLPVATNAAQKTEFDIIVRNPGVSSGTTTFNEGPCPPMSSDFSEIDLETVLLHELGHALNLAHINDSYEGTFAGQLNPNKLMNFAVVNSVKRVSPDYSARLGAAYAIAAQGNTYGGPCGLATTEMTPLTTTAEARDECPASFPSTTTPTNTVVNFNLVHATSNKFVDPAYTQVRTDGVGVGITNNAYYAFRTNNVGGTVTLTVGGYTTTPASPATCATPYGYPTKGVELALYQANSCPAAQAYPTPIAYRTFNGNGALANFTGLAANTTYLIMVDGIENTKASFSLTFTGNALPITLRDFSGIVQKEYNQLNWTIDIARDVNAIIIERSADGINFEKIGEASLPYVGKGGFKDFRPLTGDNYYRLATINSDNTREYSKIVLLRRSEDFLINIFPNPAKEWVNVEIISQKRGRYTVSIYNSIGQSVARKEVYNNLNRMLVSMPLKNYQPGMYHITVYDENGASIRNSTIVVGK